MLLFFLNFHFAFREQLFSDVSAKVLCCIAACKVICHSCCITKAEIVVEKHFLNLDLKGIIILEHGPVKKKTFEDLSFYVDVAGDSQDAFTSVTKALFYKRARNGLQ